MKLSYKRTILVGFAFFLICAFWQAYDSLVPKILTDKFGMNQANSGIIMAMDNILALFMLPLSAPYPISAAAGWAGAPPLSWRVPLRRRCC